MLDPDRMTVLIDRPFVRQRPEFHQRQSALRIFQNWRWQQVLARSGLRTGNDQSPGKHELGKPRCHFRILKWIDVQQLPPKSRASVRMLLGGVGVSTSILGAAVRDKFRLSRARYCGDRGCHRWARMGKKQNFAVSAPIRVIRGRLRKQTSVVFATKGECPIANRGTAGKTSRIVQTWFHFGRQKGKFYAAPGCAPKCLPSRSPTNSSG